MKEILDYTYQDTWQRRQGRLETLGMNYEEYLMSQHWQDIRNKALKRKNYQKCECCSEVNNLHLHHSSYKWLGDSKNELRTLNSFCDHHHKYIHELAKRYNISVRLATNYLRDPQSKITKDSILAYGNELTKELY